jgi:hypothetical protein
LDIVFAIDKSGSMRDKDSSTGNTNYVVMVNAIRTALNGLGNANVAIVSWDDDSSPDKADTDTTLNPQWINAGQPEIGRTLLKWGPGTCKETDQTIFSEGIDSAQKVMTSRVAADKDNPLRCDTKRFIIYIASSSEFRDSPVSSPHKLDTLLSSISSNSMLYKGGFQGIFTFYVGDIIRYPSELDNLTYITQTTMKPLGLAETPAPLSANNLLEKINSRMECDQGPWINNVTLTDTLYPYLKFNSANPSPSAVKPNNDGSTTLEWNLRKLNSEASWTATINTSIQLKLPVDVTKDRSRFGGDISPETPYSRVEFDWPAIDCAIDSRKHYEMPLVEGKLWVTCGAPCQVAKTVVEPASSVNASTAKTEAPVKQPGFEALTAIGGLILLAYLRKKS